MIASRDVVEIAQWLAHATGLRRGTPYERIVGVDIVREYVAAVDAQPWAVLVCVDGELRMSEWPDEASARAVYETAKLNWSEVLIVRIAVDGRPL